MQELIDKKRTEANVFMIARLFIDRSDREFDLVKAVIHRCCEEIDKQPTIEAESVRHGWWIPTEYDTFADGAPVWDKYECSECGHEHDGEEDTLTAFCPDCGTQMSATETNVGNGGIQE